MLNTRGWMRAAGVAALVGLAWAAVAFAEPRVDRRAAAMADFSRGLTAYLDVQKRSTAGVPALKRTDDPAEIAARETALGDAIRAGRIGARPGDILTPNVARVFRRDIKNDFRRRSLAGRKVMRDEIPHFRPKVNQTYPSAWPLATFPPTLFAVLPPLPDGLEYRLLSEALILRDVKANIIVDFTPRRTARTDRGRRPGTLCRARRSAAHWCRPPSADSAAPR